MRRDHPDRRTVIAAAGALGAAAVAPPVLAEAAGLTLFDPQEPCVRAFAASRGGRNVAIEGDRIRLARRLFGPGAPDRLTVIGRHADLLLLGEAAREAGYRARSLDPFPAADGRADLFIWTARRRA